jgi:hypothetical protein
MKKVNLQNPRILMVVVELVLATTKMLTLTELLHFVEEVLPIGGNGWRRIYGRFAKWVSQNSRPPHDAKSLETKFKMVCLIPLILILLLINLVNTACEDKETNW